VVAGRADWYADEYVFVIMGSKLKFTPDKKVTITQDGWKRKTRAAVELATLEWVSWFNHHRLLEPVGTFHPAEAEVNYCRQLAEKTTVEI
jgi:hypothetical protein